ncbi:MAG: sulfotransferase [Gemmataceae bacterium]|nr:sulfotransferase [Gemmataceae bacterium]
MAENNGKKKEKKWAPRMWQGCILPAWLRLAVKNKFLVHPSKWYIAFNITAISALNLALRYLQQGIYGSIPSNTPITQPPVFILGHWRTGTTLLHELLILDPRHNFPNTYQCLDPSHFLLTEGFFKKYCNFLLPTKRPMDNMEAGWDKPQEDEFALCMMGLPSPYLGVAFPNNPAPMPQAFEINRLEKREQQRWKEGFQEFLAEITFRDRRRLILKSPTHTCRIPTLLELFPDARFIHIVRDPYTLFPSTVNLWKSLGENHGLQTPSHQQLPEKVFNEFNILYKAIDRDKQLIRADRFFEVRYEDLVKEPMEITRQIYSHLGLGDFEPTRGPVQRYLDSRKDYQTNKYKPLEPALLEEINRRWGWAIDRYGYPRRNPEAMVPQPPAPSSPFPLLEGVRT